MKVAEVSCGDLSRLAADGKRHRVTAQLKIRSADVGGDGLLKAPQHGAHAGCKFTRAKRLNDVVIGAEFKAVHAVFFAGACREKDNGNSGDVVTLPYLAADFKSAVARH